MTGLPILKMAGICWSLTAFMAVLCVGAHAVPTGLWTGFFKVLPMAAKKVLPMAAKKVLPMAAKTSLAACLLIL